MQVSPFSLTLSTNRWPEEYCFEYSYVPGPTGDYTSLVFGFPMLLNSLVTFQHPNTCTVEHKREEIYVIYIQRLQ